MTIYMSVHQKKAVPVVAPRACCILGSRVADGYELLCGY